MPDEKSPCCDGLSSKLGNLYEQYQNERLSRRLGFSDEWIAEALAPNDGPGSVFSVEEKAVQAFSIAMMERKGQGIEADSVGRYDEQSVAGGDLQRFPLQMLLGRLFDLR